MFTRLEYNVMTYGVEDNDMTQLQSIDVTKVQGRQMYMYLMLVLYPSLK